MHCPYCQKAVPDFARVCPYCRNSLIYTPDGGFTAFVVVAAVILGVLWFIDHKLGTSIVDTVFSVIEFIGYAVFWIVAKVWHAVVWIFT